MLEKFLTYLEVEKRSSKHTIKSYQNDLIQFHDFLALEYELASIQEVDSVIVRSWLASMLENGLESSTVNRKLSTLKAFCRYLLVVGDLKQNPTLKVVSPKMKKRLPIFVDESRIENLFDEKLFSNDFKGQRDKLMLDILYQTGIRRIELINLKEQDVSNGKIKVLGKRNKERYIPISESLENEINRFIALKKEEGFAVSNLLLTDKGDKMYEKFVYNKVNHYLDHVTTERKKSPHVLRHTFATHMLNNGADLNAIKEILGHSSLAATQIYTHNSIEKLKETHRKAHPRA